jgi:hypothetical protein
MKTASKKIKVGARVQLKNDKQGSGTVVSLAGKAKWNVEWNEGKLEGSVTEQSSKSLCLWKLDLSAYEAADAESSESSEDEVEPPNYPELKRKFDAFAKTLEGQGVTVCCLRI